MHKVIKAPACFEDIDLIKGAAYEINGEEYTLRTVRMSTTEKHYVFDSEISHDGVILVQKVNA